MGSRNNNRLCQEEQKRNRLADKIWKSPRKKKRAASTSPKQIGSTPQRRPLGGFYPVREVISAEPTNAVESYISRYILGDKDMKRIDRKFLLGVPNEMLAAVEKEVRRLRIDRTQFIRNLITRYFREREQEKFDEALRKQNENS